MSAVDALVTLSSSARGPRVGIDGEEGEEDEADEADEGLSEHSNASPPQLPTKRKMLKINPLLAFAKKPKANDLPKELPSPPTIPSLDERIGACRYWFRRPAGEGGVGDTYVHAA